MVFTLIGCRPSSFKGSKGDEVNSVRLYLLRERIPDGVIGQMCEDVFVRADKLPIEFRQDKAALTVLPPLDTEPPGGVPDPGTAGGEVVEIPPEEGEIIVLPGDDLSSGDTPVDDNNNSVDGLGGVVDESVPNSGNNTVVVISPDDLAAILSSADDVALLVYIHVLYYN